MKPTSRPAKKHVKTTPPTSANNSKICTPATFAGTWVAVARGMVSIGKNKTVDLQALSRLQVDEKGFISSSIVLLKYNDSYLEDLVTGNLTTTFDGINCVISVTVVSSSTGGVQHQRLLWNKQKTTLLGLVTDPNTNIGVSMHRANRLCGVDVAGRYVFSSAIEFHEVPINVAGSIFVLETGQFQAFAFSNQNSALQEVVGNSTVDANCTFTEVVDGTTFRSLFFTSGVASISTASNVEALIVGFV